MTARTAARSLVTMPICLVLAALPIAGRAALASSPTEEIVGTPTIAIGVPKILTAGTPFVVHGVVRADGGRSVTFQHRSTGVWHSDGTVPVNALGHVGRRYGSLPAGAYQFRLVLRAAGKRHAVASAVAHVRVLPAPPAAVAINMPSVADAGATVAFLYSSSNVPAGATLALQRQMGTASTWGTVLTLPAVASGSGTAPALAYGRYLYRLAVLSPSGALLASMTAGLTAYGTIPLTTLLGESATNTIVSGGHTFPYIFKEFQANQTITSTVSPCRSIHLDLARADDSDSSVQSAVEQVTVVQQSADPVSVFVPASATTSLDDALAPGQSWAVNITPLTGYGDWVYINGSASCYSTTGVSFGND